MPPPLPIVMAIEDEELRHRWQTALAAGGIIARSFEQASANDACDVIVADSPASLNSAKQHFEIVSPGTILIGELPTAEPLADACLPVDASPREIRLVCELVGKLARLRREHREAVDHRDEWQTLAYRDPLCEIANRRAWDEQSPRRLAAALAKGLPVCVAIFDIDCFKQVNEVFGHARGDRVLSGMAQSLAKSVRGDDLCARIGGDEFAVLLVGLSPEAAGGIIERIRRGLTQTLTHGPEDIAHLPIPSTSTITASAGYAGKCASQDVAIDEVNDDFKKDPAILLSRLFSAADRGLSTAKQAGRQQCCAGMLRD